MHPTGALDGASLSILAVDDDPAVLSALRRLLYTTGLELVTAASAGEALAMLAAQSASIGAVVTDYSMPGMNGVDFLRAVRHAWPQVARVLLTGQADLGVAARAVNEGQLVHLFTKPWDADEVRTALVNLIRQQHQVVGRPRCEAALLAPLTPREQEVLQLVAAGRTNRQIAAALHVSPATARNHVEHILRKLGVTDRTHAAVRALELGLLNRAE